MPHGSRAFFFSRRFGSSHFALRGQHGVSHTPVETKDKEATADPEARIYTVYHVISVETAAKVSYITPEDLEQNDTYSEQAVPAE